MTDQNSENIEIGNTPKIKKMTYALRYGLIAALLAAVYSLVVYFAGQEYNRSLQWLGTLIPLSLTFVCLKAYKKDNFHQLGFGEGFKLGMLMFVVYAVLIGLYTLIYMQVINPDFIDVMMEMSVERLEDRGMSDEEIEMAMQISGKMMSPVGLLIMGLIMNMITGAVISLIASALMKTPAKN